MLPPKSEVLLKQNNKIILARTLVNFNLPFLNYPLGTWCYLINSPHGITVFDPGPLPKKPANPNMPSVNTQIILQALKKYFPNRSVSQILLSHWHYDHSQNAPNLQFILNSQFNYLAPIRIHPQELKPKMFCRLYPHSLHKVFIKSGYPGYLLGKPVKHLNKIKGTEFTVFHAPGHTTGDIALINRRHRLVIGGWWLTGNHKLIEFIQNKLIDEDCKRLSSTIKKLRLSGYTFYTHHPKI